MLPRKIVLTSIVKTFCNHLSHVNMSPFLPCIIINVAFILIFFNFPPVSGKFSW